MESLVQSGISKAIVPQNIEFVFYIDEDDEPSLAKAEQLQNPPHVEATVRHIVGERVVLSEMWNRAAELASHDVMMHCGDDILFRSSNWDRNVLKVFDESPDKIWFVHGRDGFHDAKFGTHGFIHRRWMETVGYFVPPYFSSDWNDTWLNDVANALDRRVFLRNVYTEHMHFVFGKAPRDQTHIDREARGARDNVMALYHSEEHQALRQADVAKLQAVIDSHR